MPAHLLQTSSWIHLSACYDDYFSEIKCQFSLVWPYICISMVLFNIDNDYRAVRWKVRWCVPFESTNAEYFVQWLFTLWKQIVMFNSCILMYTCTVSLMRWLGFFFWINCYFYYPVSSKYLNCLIFTFENFIFFGLVSVIDIRKSEIRKKKIPH